MYALVPILASWSFDTAGMLDFASDLFESLAPAFIVVLGIILGVGVLSMVLNEIRKAVKGATGGAR